MKFLLRHVLTFFIGLSIGYFLAIFLLLSSPDVKVIS